MWPKVDKVCNFENFHGQVSNSSIHLLRIFTSYESRRSILQHVHLLKILVSPRRFTTVTAIVTTRTETTSTCLQNLYPLRQLCLPLVDGSKPLTECVVPKHGTQPSASAAVRPVRGIASRSTPTSAVAHLQSLPDCSQMQSSRCRELTRGLNYHEGSTSPCSRSCFAHYMVWQINNLAGSAVDSGLD